jgi:deazaflavin-dependent oxidoreductase (nitroreductase family)
MSELQQAFVKPSPTERIFNRIFGLLVGLGLGMRHNYLLLVRGRKSGRIYSTPVNVLDRGDRRFLIAPRGETQWVRNARASGQVTLKKGMRRESFVLQVIPDQEKPELLKAYLDSFSTTVQRYFPIPAGSGPEAFAPLSAHYPVFELLPIGPP